MLKVLLVKLGPAFHRHLVKSQFNHVVPEAPNNRLTIWWNDPTCGDVLTTHPAAEMDVIIPRLIRAQNSVVQVLQVTKTGFLENYTFMSISNVICIFGQLLTTSRPKSANKVGEIL